MPDSQEGSFRITDKRMSSGEGAAQQKDRESASPSAQATEKEPGPGQALEEVTFVTFLLSLYSSALAAFGRLPDPQSGEDEVHIEAGKQMIDILGILMEKTKGNLTAEESRLLDNILYELRMLYLEKTSKIKL